MKYDFTSIMDRHGMDAIAVDGIGGESGYAAAPSICAMNITIRSSDGRKRETA